MSPKARVPKQCAWLFVEDALLDDCQAERELWAASADRLFVDEDPKQVEVTIIDGQRDCRMANTPGALAEAFGRDFDGVRIILLPQEYSWGRLRASTPCIEELCRKLRPMPALARTMQAFGERVTASNEPLGEYSFREGLDRYEECCIFKCVERHDRSGDDNPWSLRQYAVYTQYNAKSKQTTILVLNPQASRTLTARLRALGCTTGPPATAATVKAMLATSCSTNWSAYLSFLEHELATLSLKAYPDSEGYRAGLSVDNEDLHKLQQLQELVLRAKQQVPINRKAFRGLQRTELHTASDTQVRSADKRSLQAMRSGLHALVAHEERLECVINQAVALSGFMQNILSNRSLQTLESSGRVTTNLAQLAQEDNRLMLRLSTESRKDSRTLKSITVLTLAYLPVSFVSTLLSMGYISISYDDGQGSLRVRPEMWIFLFLSCVLLLITFGSWLTLDLRRARLESRMLPAQTDHTTPSVASCWEKAPALV